MKNIIISLLFLFISHWVVSQSPQSPDEFLGYELGSEFTYHHRMIDYFNHVGSTSTKVQIQEYGKTYERRPLILAFVSSEDNIKNLEQIRKNNLINTQLEQGTINGKELAIVWLSYNIHGNESVSMEASMQVLHTLVTRNTDGINEWLENTLVILDPCENPDGRDRYTNWYNQAKNVVPNINPDSWEHHESWPGGRFNHYIFDLNRDWAWQTQIESQARTTIYQQWMPHVHVDLHEMGVNSPYFFGPSAKPFHEVITSWQREFHDLSGDNHAKYFDKEGWLFYTKEVFDLLYPSYGDTWPVYQGAMGFTYEQGGSGRAGLGVRMQTGDTLTLADRIAHHYTASLSTIEVSYKNREKLLSEFKNYFSEGINNPYGDYKSFVIKGENHPERLKAVTELLDGQSIQYGYADASGRSKSMIGFDYLNNKESSFSISGKDIVISAHQPLSRFVKVLFEPKTMYEDSLTYDLTAWSIPYIYEVEAYAVKERISLSDKEVKFNFTPNAPANESAYAYYAAWNDFQDVKFLAALLNKNIKVRYASQAFKAEGQHFERGTLIITKADNEDLQNFHKQVITIANQLNQNLIPAKTGLVEQGKDLGSGSVRFIHKPKIALINGDGSSPTAFGEIWHYFEQQLHYPVTVINTNYLSSVDLNKYNTIILNTGYYSSYSDKILAFVKNGGKVIALENALNLFANNDKTSLGKAYEIHQKKISEKTKKSGNALLQKYGDAQRNSLSNSVEGSIYKVYLDETHPLSFGEGTDIHLMKRNDSSYPYIDNGWNLGIFKSDSHVSGFVGYKLKQELINTLAIGEENYGKGNIIYFTDSPIIRGFWHSGKLLFGNAIFFVGQ